MNKIPVVVGAVILVLAVAKGTFFILPEGRQAIITQFGRPVGEPITNAGIHFKKPVVQDVRYVDKRILTWDGFPNQIPTKDKKYIKVDTTARWIISDALKFIQTVRNERGAKARIDAILDASTRDVISGHNVVEAVRNTNLILDKIKERRAKLEKLKLTGAEVLEEEVTGEIENIKVGRENLSEMIAKAAGKELAAFGIKVIDVQFRRISYEKSVEKKVYERMISERQRIAQKIRSIGKGEKAKIEGRLAKDLKVIESQAYQKAQIVKGGGDAKATAIYVKAFSKDKSFFEFVRTMKSYEKSLGDKTKFILSADSDYFKFLGNKVIR